MNEFSFSVHWDGKEYFNQLRNYDVRFSHKVQHWYTITIVCCNNFQLLYARKSPHTGEWVTEEVIHFTVFIIKDNKFKNKFLFQYPKIIITVMILMGLESCKLYNTCLYRLNLMTTFCTRKEKYYFYHFIDEKTNVQESMWLRHSHPLIKWYYLHYKT